MNYQKHYDLLIQRAKNRSLIGYAENHHILPKCLGGGDKLSNIVRLTPEEHYVAHQLLVKIYPGNHKIAYAAFAMCGSNDKVTRPKNKIYSWLRKEYAEIMRVRLTGNQYNKGKKLSAEHVAIFKLPKTEEHKRKISEGNKGKTKGIPRGPQSDEHKRKKGEARAKAWALWRLQKEARGELSS